MAADLIRCQNCGRTNRVPAAAKAASGRKSSALGVGAAEQPGDQDAKVLAGEAGRGEQRLEQGADRGYDLRIAESKSRGPQRKCSVAITP
jgi:hypothetical protein